MEAANRKGNDIQRVSDRTVCSGIDRSPPFGWKGNAVAGKRSEWRVEKREVVQGVVEARQSRGGRACKVVAHQATEEAQ